MTQSSDTTTFQWYAGYWANGKFDATKGGELWNQKGLVVIFNHPALADKYQQEIIIPDPTKPQAAPPASKDDKTKAAKISGGKGGKP